MVLCSESVAATCIVVMTIASSETRNTEHVVFLQRSLKKRILYIQDTQKATTHIVLDVMDDSVSTDG